MARKVIGIDLGTSYSCVAYTDDKGDVKIISNNWGNYITPSVVNFESKVATVGEGAIEKRATDAKNTIFQVKRFMGRNANDETLKQRKWPFEIIADEKGSANIRVTPSDSNGQSVTYCPEQISARIICHMKEIAEKWIGSDVADAVITVPANFSDLQRQATKDAGNIAGLNVLRIINEPTAAALAYGEGKGDTQTRKILVYDLGGGTFDVSIVEMKGMNATVKSTAGLTYLGGEDFDYRLYEEAVARLTDMNVDVVGGDWNLMKACEQAKRTLSNTKSARIEYKGASFNITVDTFNELCDDLFEKTIQCVDDALEQARCKKTDIDDIVLVGGSSRIPRIQQLLSDHFDGKHKLRFDIQPDHAVAHGAALLAYSLANGSIVPSSSITPSKQKSSIKLSDVTPHSLGTDMVDDQYDIVIFRNTPIPVSASVTHSNYSDNVSMIRVKVLEGEEAKASQNRLLGRFFLKTVPKQSCENKIKIRFSVDSDGILTVDAVDEDTGNAKEITVRSSRLTPSEREQMIRDARKFSEEEKIEITKREARSTIRISNTRNASKVADEGKNDMAMREARSTFDEALMRMKLGIQYVESEDALDLMKEMIDREQNWIDTNQIHGKEEIISHVNMINAMMSKFYM